MEYWGSKTDDGQILNSVPCHPHKNRSHSAKPNIPILQYSIIPLCWITAQPIFSDPRRRDQRLAQRTRFSLIKERGGHPRLIQDKAWNQISRINWDVPFQFRMKSWLGRFQHTVLIPSQWVGLFGQRCPGRFKNRYPVFPIRRADGNIPGVST